MEKFADWKRGDPIAYIREDAPQFDLPSLSGKRYETRVPDTLELGERAYFGLNVLTEALDPQADYELYFRADFDRNPPIMSHDFNDVCDVKFQEALPLMRRITGSHFNEEAERGRMAARLRMLGFDGLLWEPKRGRPWVEAGVGSMEYTGDFTSGESFFPPFAGGRFLGVLALYYLFTGDRVWCESGKRLVDGFRQLMIYRDDFAFFQEQLYGPNPAVNPNAPVPKDAKALHTTVWPIQGLAQFYRTTGYEPAGELAEKLVRHLRYNSDYYGPEGQFTSDHPHQHGHSLGLLAMADYAMAAGDTELLAFVRKGYEAGRSLGIPRIGYFPERYNQPTVCEGCAVGDMIGLAVKLSQAGVADYWDDADRYLRNHFAEMQLMKTDWIHEHANALAPTEVGPYETGDRVPERNVGGFAGWASLNEWWVNGRGIMHCCTGNCTRAIYYAWESILQFSAGRLQINLLLNRASAWADVNSYIPYEGRVDVHIKQECTLAIRIPEWAAQDQVICTINGKVSGLTFNDRYAQIGKTKAGETVTLCFPIQEQSVDIEAETKSLGTEEYRLVKYRLVIKGNDVVDIDPPGKLGPLYQRSHYRKGEVRWQSVERFVPDQVHRW